MNDAQIVLEDFYQTKSFQAISNVLNKVILSNFQSIDLLKCLYYKSGLVAYDTGLGKTVLAAAIMKSLLNENPKRRFIFFARKDQLIQTPQKLAEYCDISCYASTAESEQIEYLISSGVSGATVLMLTHECLNNAKLMFNLLIRKESFCGVFVDEAHMLCNWKKASSASMLRSLINNFEYRYLLTATPIVRDELQLANLLMFLDRNLFQRPEDIRHVRKEDIVELSRVAELLLSRDRESVGAKGEYRSHAVYVKPHGFQHGVKGNIMLACKGPGAQNQVDKLKDLLIELKDKGKKGLIYVNQHKIREWVEENLKDCGFSYAVINGFVKIDERKKIFEMFDSGGLDFVITSVTMAIDMDSDYVIFYEFTEFVQQMIGRAHRGLKAKTLDIYFLFTKASPEIEYFLNNTYAKSLMIRQILGKEYKELISIGETLTENLEV